MDYKIIHTDNFANDYPDEKEVLNLPDLPKPYLERICEEINYGLEKTQGKHQDRFYKVVPKDYKLIPGFEP